MQGLTIIVKKITQLIAPVIFLYGIYIIVHGHLTPGGGFAGGVILASSFILQILAFGKILEGLLKEEHGLQLLESFAILFFMLIGAVGLILVGKVFFANFLGTGIVGELISAGYIPLQNLVVGAEVCAAIASIFIALLIFKDEVDK